MKAHWLGQKEAYHEHYQQERSIPQDPTSLSPRGGMCQPYALESLAGSRYSGGAPTYHRYGPFARAFQDVRYCGTVGSVVCDMLPCRYQGGGRSNPPEKSRGSGWRLHLHFTGQKSGQRQPLCLSLPASHTDLQLLSGVAQPQNRGRRPEDWESVRGGSTAQAGQLRHSVHSVGISLSFDPVVDGR